MDEEEATEPIRSFGRTVLRVASGLAVASTLLALACSYLLTQPLRALAKAAKRPAAGREAAIRVTTPVRERTGDTVAFQGPIRIDLDGRPSMEAWTVGA
jgi:hypothetical protein